jgi:CBS domain-containing protein
MSHSGGSTPLSSARRLLQPDSGSPSRSPQLAHGSLVSDSSSRKNSLIVPSPRMSRGSFHASGSNKELKSFLSSHTVRELDIFNRPIVEIPIVSTIEQGFERLLTANILAAPVYIDHIDSGKREYTGFLDIRDLTSSLVYSHDPSARSQPWNESYITTVCNNKFTNNNSINGSGLSLTYLSRRNPFRPVSLDSTLFDVARLLSHQTHRLPVLNTAGHCIAILSQSSLVAYLAKHKAEITHDLAQSMGQIQLGLCKVITIAADKPAWEAFKLLDSSGVSGIGVVDNEGKLVGNTSARDLRLYVANKGKISLDECILDYLAQIRQREDPAMECHPSCAVSLQQSLGHVIGLMFATKHHRVFLVDGDRKPIGVVSVSDVMKFAGADEAQLNAIALSAAK